jgi:hypothetical protein
VQSFGHKLARVLSTQRRKTRSISLIETKGQKGIMFKNQARPDCCAIGRIVILIRYNKNIPLVQNWQFHKDAISAILYLLVDPIFYELISFLNVQKFWELNMYGSTRERSFADIIMNILGYLLHYYTFLIHCGLVICRYMLSLWRV